MQWLTFPYKKIQETNNFDIVFRLKLSLDNLKAENKSLSHELSVTKLELKKEKDRLVELQSSGEDRDLEQSTKNKVSVPGAHFDLTH